MELEIGTNLGWLLFALGLMLTFRGYYPKRIEYKKLELEDKLKKNELARKKEWELIVFGLNTLKADTSTIENLKAEYESLKAKSGDVEKKKDQLAKEEEVMKMVMCLYSLSQENEKIMTSIKDANSSYEWIKKNIKNK